MNQEFLAPIVGVRQAAVEFGAADWLVAVLALIAAYSLISATTGIITARVLPEFRGVKPLSAIFSTFVFVVALLLLLSGSSGSPDIVSSAIVLGFVASGVVATATVAFPEETRSLFLARDSEATPDRICEALGIDVGENESAATVLLRETNREQLVYLGSQEGTNDIDRSDIVTVIERLAEESSGRTDVEHADFTENLRAVRDDVEADRFKHVDDIDETSSGSWEAIDTETGSVEKLKKELKNLRTDSDLNHRHETEERAYDLLQNLIQYLDGETELPEVVDSIEDVVETLKVEATVLKSLRRCNDSLAVAGHGQGTSKATMARDSLNEGAKSLQGVDSPTAENARNLFDSLAQVLEESEKREQELKEIRSEKEEYEEFYDYILQSWNIEWARSYLGAEDDVSDQAIAKEALSEGLFGARVVAAVARDLREKKKHDLPRGTTAATLLEELGDASTGRSDAVEAVLEEAISELQSYSIVENQIREDIDTDVIDRRTDSIRSRAEEISVSGLAQAVNDHLDDQLQSLETVRDVDFITPYVIYEHAERLESLLQKVADNRTQETTSFEELDDKREELEQEFKNKNVHTGNKLSRHYLNIAEELQREAKEAQALGKTDTALAKADAAEKLMDGLLDTYRTRTLRRYLEAI